MINKRKSGRTLDNIGIRWYGFDFQLEKNIYCYLCSYKMKKRNLKKVNEKLRFVSYSQWKQYICTKYENYNSDELMEFSRYLNQRIRKIKPIREFIMILISVIITLVITKIFELIETIGIDSVLSIVIKGILVIAFIVIPFMFLLVDVFTHIQEDNIDEYFLKDYKEIIDEIIKSKSKNATLSLIIRCRNDF